MNRTLVEGLGFGTAESRFRFDGVAGQPGSMVEGLGDGARVYGEGVGRTEPRFVVKGFSHSVGLRAWTGESRLVLPGTLKRSKT